MIRFENVYVRKRKNNVLENISFQIKKGSFCVICGKEGAGKSELLETVMGLVFHTKGDIYIYGKKIHKMRKKDYSKIRYVSDDILWFKRMRADKFLRWAASVASDYDIKLQEQLCEKWNVEIKEMLLNMSFGDNKKIMLIAAICAKPDILILDEPSYYLDLSCLIELMNVLKKFHNDGKTIVIAEQSLENISDYGDCFIYMKNGKVLKKGKLPLGSKHWKVLKICGEKEKKVSDEKIIFLKETNLDRYFLCKESSDYILNYLKSKSFSEWTVEEVSFSEQLEEDYSRWF